ncbi:hypothetical protein Pfo_029111 [Paulownia fortunei]|nr:hypothetical protein Pfo_029111 [Paulownia fortunei]
MEVLLCFYILISGKILNLQEYHRSNKKDAPARLLEWIDAGVVYHRNGAIGLLRYAAVLASGGDVHMASDSVVAAALYDEGAVMVIHAVMINCKIMLERSSNIICLFDLLIPSLVLLINLLQKLQEAKEQHRNTKLMNALLQLHREVSPKLAACAAELSHSCPDFALGFGAICHLLASALACWHLHVTSLLALGPKETCSLLCLLNDLFPDESIWLWKNGMPMLSPLRAMAVGTLLGPQREKQINWYLRPRNPEKLVAQLSPQLVKLGEIILHCAVSMSVVIQDALRVFVIRIACLNLDYASLLVKPIISWISHRLLEPSMLSDVDAYKVHQLLKFLAILLEHPNAKPLLLKEGGFQMLTKVLEMCIGAANSDVKQFHENINLAKYEFSLLSWSIPVFQSISLISDGRASVQLPGVHDRNIPCSFTAEECFIFWSYLLRFCMDISSLVTFNLEDLYHLMPYLLCLASWNRTACLSVGLQEMGSSTEGQSALLSIVKHIQSSTIKDSEFQIKHESDASCSVIPASEWKDHPPLLCCWNTLLRSIDSKDVPAVQVAAAIDALASGALGFCRDGESVNSERIDAIKFLFGVKNDDSWKIKETANLLLLLLQKSSGREEVDVEIVSGYTSLLTPPVSSRIHKFADRSMERLKITAWMNLEPHSCGVS